MRLRERFQRMMYGRYGNDSLGTFCFVMYLVLWFVTMFFRKTPVQFVLNVVAYVFVIAYFYRFFSRNIYKRQQENQKYLQMKQKVKNYWKFLRLKFAERSGVNKLFRCPKCHQIIRVPKGRGKIAISCPKCRFEFIKRS
nr:hypothetical protein [Eubacterium sp.]